MKRITIDPVTRLEGHGKVEVFLTLVVEVEGSFAELCGLSDLIHSCDGKSLVEEHPLSGVQDFFAPVLFFTFFSLVEFPL
jgi:F420-non-reducing hydrogenase large subunit